MADWVTVSFTLSPRFSGEVVFVGENKMAVKNEATEQENSPAKIFDPEAGMDSEGS